MSLLSQANEAAVTGKLALPTANHNYMRPVQGRVVHIDADFLAYQVSAESKEELDTTNKVPRKSVEDMQHNAKNAVEHIMRLAGGTSYHLHTTPSGSSKGGRPEYAITKEYQANRKSSEEKPEFLDHIRSWLVRELGGTAHLDQEADDGMSQAAWAAHEAGTGNLCVIASKDKDLLMCPGWHLMPDDSLENAGNLFGHIWIDDTKSTKKCMGLGTKFFWAQLLMGDPADNIGGLPAVTGKHWMAVKPTQAYLKDMERWAKLDKGEEADRLEKKIDATLAKTKPCGAVMAHSLLDTASSDKECYRIVRGLWVDLEASGYEFTHWRTGKKVTATQALLGDMRTLWMRRTKNPDDVIDWLKEVTR